jgi:hypothetical protein
VNQKEQAMKKQILLYTVALSCVGWTSFGAPSRVEFKSATYQVSELQGWTFFKLTCTPPPTSDHVVRVQVHVGFLTASPADVYFSGGMAPEEIEVVFAPGASEAEGGVGVRDDHLPEEDETISLSLGAITGPAILGDLAAW